MKYECNISEMKPLNGKEISHISWFKCISLEAFVKHFKIKGCFTSGAKIQKLQRNNGRV